MSKLLILDIDGTIIYADTVDEWRDTATCDFRVDVDTVCVSKRPHLVEFLRWSFDTFAVAFWSLSDKEYVDAILENVLEADMKPLFVWYGDKCTKVKIQEGLYDTSVRYCKELKKVWKHLKRTVPKYDETSTIIVDDTPFTYSRNYGNAVAIASFTGDINDVELLRVQRVLSRLNDTSNVRDRS